MNGGWYMETQKWRELLIPYEQAVQELIVKFESVGREYNRLGLYSPIELVSGRVKKISSIIEKARKKDITFDHIEEKMEDIAGIRIICQFVEDIDKVVTLIHERDGKDLEIVREKDYVSERKESGYRSYHMIIRYPVYTALGEFKVLAEIQIRTLAMNFWATIEHSLRYKYNGKMPAELQERLVHAANAAHVLDQEMSVIRNEIIDAQVMFKEKSSLVADIVNNIQNLFDSGNVEEAKKIQHLFLDVLRQDSFEKLQEFNKQLDVIAEVFDAQSINR